MNIGEVIRKYRKEAGITQEEMAKRLGVTTPAVNKWENNNSQPDIALLAPIARLLNITTDTLLSFREDLTEAEIANFTRKLSQDLEKKEYREVFAEAEKMSRDDLFKKAAEEIGDKTFHWYATSSRGGKVKQKIAARVGERCGELDGRPIARGEVDIAREYAIA